MVIVSILPATYKRLQDNRMRDNKGKKIVESEDAMFNRLLDVSDQLHKLSETKKGRPRT